MLNGLVDCLCDGTKACDMNLGPEVVAGVAIDDLCDNRGLGDAVVDVYKDINQLAVFGNQSRRLTERVVIEHLNNSIDGCKLVTELLHQIEILRHA